MSTGSGGNTPRDTTSLVNKIFNLNVLKFKHVYGAPDKKERCYDNVKITKNANDSQFCCVNPKFLAVCVECTGGGSFIVLPIEETGRSEVNQGRVIGHKGPVLDIKWNPFNDNVIASSSDDCTIKLWHIPDGGLMRPLADSLVTLTEHKRRVPFIEWHPTAEGILFSVGFDHMILVWNVSGAASGRGQLVNTIDCHPDTIQSISLNRDGSLLASTCKDKRIRVIEPRTGRVMATGCGHQGSKSSKVIFLGDTGRLLTTGFSRHSDRQWAVWSQFDLKEPLTIENVDSSSGVLFPFYDHDTKMVYIAGKGDGSIRYYELSSEPPWCHYINQFITGFPQRGLGFMPKRGLDCERCEVFRFYKLHAMKCMVEPISMIVPRKSSIFQADIYPDTAAPTPALTAEEWIMGKNRLPVLISMKTGSQIDNRTHKPPVQDAQSLNNDRKFIFISEPNAVDYRSRDLADNSRHQPTTPGSGNQSNANSPLADPRSETGELIGNRFFGSQCHSNSSSSSLSAASGQSFGNGFRSRSGNGSPYGTNGTLGSLMRSQSGHSSPYHQNRLSDPNNGRNGNNGCHWTRRSTDELNYLNDLYSSQPQSMQPQLRNSTSFGDRSPRMTELDETRKRIQSSANRFSRYGNGYLSSEQLLIPRTYDELLILYKHKLEEIQILRELNAKKDMKIKELEDQLDDFRFDEN